VADATNAGTPSAGGQLSGEATRQAAIRRLEKEQAPRIRKSQSMGPNTGSTGLSIADKLGIHQEPGSINQSPHPPKPKRI
jgi:hypothetical protein